MNSSEFSLYSHCTIHTVVKEYLKDQYAYRFCILSEGACFSRNKANNTKRVQVPFAISFM